MWHNEHPGTDIAPLIGYSTSFYAMQAVDRIKNRDPVSFDLRLHSNDWGVVERVLSHARRP
eukprot:SAG31_NODE_8596_length_1423_cov_1.358006_1_plen_60_part_10